LGAGFGTGFGVGFETGFGVGFDTGSAGGAADPGDATGARNARALCAATSTTFGTGETAGAEAATRRRGATTRCAVQRS
jgi:hypothetical protein